MPSRVAPGPGEASPPSLRYRPGRRKVLESQSEVREEERQEAQVLRWLLESGQAFSLQERELFPLLVLLPIGSICTGGGDTASASTSTFRSAAPAVPCCPLAVHYRGQVGHGSSVLDNSWNGMNARGAPANRRPSCIHASNADASLRRRQPECGSSSENARTSGSCHARCQRRFLGPAR